MRTATPEEIALLEMLATELEHDHVQRVALALAHDRELRAVEQELALAVSIVDGGSAASALVDRRAILETGGAARLPFDEIGQGIDTSHERVQNSLVALAVASFHWKWGERSKASHASETFRVPGSGGVLQHTSVAIAAAHDQLPPVIVTAQSSCRSGQSSGIVRLS